MRRFAQLFINPRMSSESNPNLVRKPVQSLQREFSRNAEDEDKRVAEVQKCLSNDDFFSHLYCGKKSVASRVLRAANIV